ncbi:N-formylglutamate deformylase [Ancylobacter sp. 6x-1]|uniref:N-formylglutamate deformylase n=1 Tax=Ancylobacter crimeensis TaxID=2579147 RepID=A0ABT0D7F2_9HYPH|nr:N-formylglutamate deformylase [Ancylobacter crimeensis]MCK0195876.1 N-formylglutamate deformylase [Ancylobacter crimeensis]
MTAPAFITVTRGEAPLILSLPHTGTDIPPEIMADLASPWVARKDCDWWIDRLYAFAAGMGATLVRTGVSRTVIDVNRDPSGSSLYPGQATTELCPTTTFDGEPLYRKGRDPDVAARKAGWFVPYHATLEAEVARLRALHPRVVLYDCHSIRSVIPRLFEGVLPCLNIGTNAGTSCAPELQVEIEAIAAGSRFSFVSNGRFKGGWITRHYGRPEEGVHAVQMELACRAYMAEPTGPADEGNWPSPFDDATAAPIRAVLARILDACLAFARTGI